MKMSKMSSAAVAVLCCSGLFLSSCVYDVPMYGGVSVSGGYGGMSVSAWTDASYDANGFPIYGYYYGRPVYGYSATGAAIFTFAALTAACFVPHWAPAPWYRGHWQYPRHIHRVSAPKHFPHDHRPARRPIGGLQAPIHKNPQKVFHEQHRNFSAPQHKGMPNQHDIRDKEFAKQHHQAPQFGPQHLDNRRDNGSKLPVFNPQQHKNHPNKGMNNGASPLFGEAHNRPQHDLRGDNHKMPQMSRPSAPSAPSVPQMSRPSAPSAPSVPQISRPSAPSAPSMPQMSRPSAPSAPSVQRMSAPKHNFGGNGGGFGNHHGGHRH